GCHPCRCCHNSRRFRCFKCRCCCCCCCLYAVCSSGPFATHFTMADDLMTTAFGSCCRPPPPSQQLHYVQGAGDFVGHSAEQPRLRPHPGRHNPSAQGLHERHPYQGYAERREHGREEQGGGGPRHHHRLLPTSGEPRHPCYGR
ncbi:unnamed protein product, partial [Ectocarpus sp. 12 AP-2014]